MTAPERFEQDLPQLLAQLAAGPRPDYRDPLVEAVARTPQRPAWTFPRRWLPVDIALTPVRRASMPMRVSALIALLLLAIAGALLLAGASRPQLPEPFGPARNGLIVYGSKGDLYALDPGSTTPRLLLGGEAYDSSPAFSPRGDRLLFLRSREVGGRSSLMTMRPDGSDVTEVATRLASVQSTAWSPDGSSIAIGLAPAGVPILNFVDLVRGFRGEQWDPVRRESPAWRPGHPAQLLDREQAPGGRWSLRLQDTTSGAVVTLAIPEEDGAWAPYHGQRASWSPDGRRLVFETGAGAGRTGPRLILKVADIADDGTVTSIRPFLHDPGADFEYAGVFTPDGRSLVFASQAGCAFQAWIAPLDDPSAAVPVGAPVADTGQGCTTTGILPYVSPDGRQVLTAMGDGRSEDRLFLGGVDGAGAIPLDATTDGPVAWQRLAP